MSDKRKPVSELAEAYLRQSCLSAKKEVISFASLLERMRRGETKQYISETAAFLRIVNAACRYRELEAEIIRRDAGDVSVVHTDSERLDALAKLVDMRGEALIHRTRDNGLAVDYGAFGFSARADIRELCDQIASYVSTSGDAK